MEFLKSNGVNLNESVSRTVQTLYDADDLAIDSINAGEDIPEVLGLGVEDLSVLATGLINDLDLDVEPDDLEVAFEDAHLYGGGLRIASIKEAIDSLTDI